MLVTSIIFFFFSIYPNSCIEVVGLNDAEDDSYFGDGEEGKRGRGSFI